MGARSSDTDSALVAPTKTTTTHSPTRGPSPEEDTMTTTTTPQRHLAATIVGTIVLDFDVRGVLVLTPCCEASGKGSYSDGRPATVCRSCYVKVDDIHGAVLDPTNPAHEEVLAGWLRPTLERYAISVASSTLSRAARILG